MKDLFISELKIEEVEKLWADSPHSSVFTNPYVLQRLSPCTKWFAVCSLDRVLCTWPICLNDKGFVFKPLFTYYVGPIWQNRVYSQIAVHRSLSSPLVIYEKFLTFFEENFQNLSSSFPPEITDLRPIDWWNFHNSEKNRIQIFPRYTAIIDLCPTLDPQSMYRQVRRSEIRTFEKKYKSDFFCEMDISDFDEVIELYKQNVPCYKENIPNDVCRSIRELCLLVKDGFGFFSVFRFKEDKILAQFSLVLRGKKRSNLVINLTNHQFKSTGLTAFATNKVINEAKELGDTMFDFNGANSPRRGDDKHSYGAKPLLYFDIEYTKKHFYG